MPPRPDCKIQPAGLGEASTMQYVLLITASLARTSRKPSTCPSVN